MVKEFSGDYRILRVVFSSSDPIATLNAIRNGTYSIITFLDMLEMLDVKETLREEEIFIEKQKQQSGG